MKWAPFHILYQASKIIYEDCVHAHVYSSNRLIYALWFLLVRSYAFYFPCVDTDLDSEEARKAFPLTLCIEVNLSWRFPEPQALENESLETGQSAEGGGLSLWGCHAWCLWGCKWNGREMGSESGEDGSTSGVSGKHAFMLIDTHGQAIALQT